MIASEDAHAHHGDGNRILRWQKKFSRAGCRKEIVNVNRGKSIRISVAGAGVTASRKTTTERIESPHEDDRTADHFQHLHDVCLVWTSEISRGAALESNRDQLADCFF
jgi:hypothetical protein